MEVDILSMIKVHHNAENSKMKIVLKNDKNPTSSCYLIYSLMAKYQKVFALSE